jgi:HPt (histidine-containing phosphotransfer) domain-containing protein
MNSNDPNPEQVTDLTYLLSICGDDQNFKKEMIETFLNNTPPLINEMKDHIKDSRWKEIGDIAHKMKPSFTFMGIHSAKNLILELERNGRQKEYTTEIPGMVLKLETICSKAFIELKDKMGE